jgi:hypothetical protein
MSHTSKVERLYYSQLYARDRRSASVKGAHPRGEMVRLICPACALRCKAVRDSLKSCPSCKKGLMRERES